MYMRCKKQGPSRTKKIIKKGNKEKSIFHAF